MGCRKQMPRVVDEPTEERRNAMEESLLSLVNGFQKEHLISDSVMCSILIDVADWLACPHVATRITLPMHALAIDDQADESEVS